MDTQTAGDSPSAISIHRQFEDGRFDFGFASRISVFGVECLERTFRVLAEVSLFTVIQSVFSYLFAPAEKASEGNQSHCLLLDIVRQS